MADLSENSPFIYAYGTCHEQSSLWTKKRDASLPFTLLIKKGDTKIHLYACSIQFNAMLLFPSWLNLDVMKRSLMSTQTVWYHG